MQRSERRETVARNSTWPWYPAQANGQRQNPSQPTRRTPAPDEMVGSPAVSPLLQRTATGLVSLEGMAFPPPSARYLCYPESRRVCDGPKTEGLRGGP